MTQQKEALLGKGETVPPQDFQLNILEQVIALEQRDRIAMNFSDKIADKITSFSGSMLYVGLHVVWFGGWILLNRGWLRMKPFDPFPFNFLTMIVSLEAIFLSAFILISQNKQALQADKRAKIDLQVNLITERETTKLIEMIAEIQQVLGIHQKEDVEMKKLTQVTDISRLADQIDAIEREHQGHEAAGPNSAADTSK